MIDLCRLRLLWGEARIDQSPFGDLQLLSAIGADAAHQPLGTDQVDRRGHEKRFDSHVHQAGNCRWRIICVQSREHQMAGQCCFDSDFSSFKISNLTYEDDVWILSQERSERGSKIQPNLILHLHLIDTG